jgi:hypothetical protein
MPLRRQIDLLSGSTTMILFFCDISGLSEAKRRHYQSVFNCPIKFISPYDHLLNSDFVKDYDVFCQQVGIEKYCQIVAQQISQLPDQPFIAIGESVGATALWCNTPILKTPNCFGAICLYGSRIRDHLNIEPGCKTHLIFSSDEKYFLTPTVETQLNDNVNINLDTVALPHGFASPGHSSFDQMVFATVTRTLKDLLGLSKNL